MKKIDLLIKDGYLVDAANQRESRIDIGLAAGKVIMIDGVVLGKGGTIIYFSLIQLYLDQANLFFARILNTNRPFCRTGKRFP
jgi:hypothetical protein